LQADSAAVTGADAQDPTSSSITQAGRPVEVQSPEVPSLSRQAALTQASLAYSFSDITFTATPGAYTNPATNGAWQDRDSARFRTSITWMMMSNPNYNPNDEMAAVSIKGNQDVPGGLSYSLAVRQGDSLVASRCPLGVDLGGSNGYYSVTFASSCIGTPAHIYWLAYFTYDTDPPASSIQTELEDAAPEASPLPEAVPSGYWLFARDGGVFSEGGLPFLGSLGNIRLNAPIVAGATVPGDSGGYWMVGSDGGVFQFGNAHLYGSLGNVRLNQPIVAMASTSDGRGYWLFARDGGVFEFGDARFYGSLGNVRLNQPIVAAAAMPNNGGYWLFAADGGVFEFGDAHFYGSLGNIHLNRPIVSGSADRSGSGYWLTGADGGLFEFGDAPFEGSGAGVQSSPVSAIASGQVNGYRMVSQSGEVLTFGSLYAGEPYPAHLNQPIVGIGSVG
jgi:hypothetical protein